jgi:hypothetical protein
MNEEDERLEYMIKAVQTRKSIRLPLSLSSPAYWNIAYRWNSKPATSPSPVTTIDV